MKTLIFLLSFALLTSTLGNAQATAVATAPDDCPSMMTMVGKTYTLTADKLYIQQAGNKAFDVLPIWEEQVVTVKNIICLQKQDQHAIRVLLVLENGTEAFLEVNETSELPKYLRPTALVN
jgi:hypothetical protein